MVIVVIVRGISVMITGALGVSIVYGPDIDPMIKLIYTTVVGA